MCVRGLFPDWVLDMGIFPLCGLLYPLPEVPGSGTNGTLSHSSSQLQCSKLKIHPGLIERMIALSHERSASLDTQKGFPF